MSDVWGISTYKCRRQVRDKKEKILSGKGQENVILQLVHNSSDGKKIVLRREYGNYEFGPQFNLEANILKKWIDAYEDWTNSQKPKTSYEYPPFFVAKFPFHKDYRDDAFTISNIEYYVVEFRKYNDLPVLSEDDLVEMVLSLQQPFQSQPEETTTHEKWDKLRDMILKMTQQK